MLIPADGQYDYAHVNKALIYNWPGELIDFTLCFLLVARSLQVQLQFQEPRIWRQDFSLETDVLISSPSVFSNIMSLQGYKR